MSDTAQAPMSTAEALDHLRTGANLFRAFRRGEELVEILAGAEQRLADLQAATAAAESRRAAADAAAAASETRATAAEADATRRIAAANDTATREVAEAKDEAKRQSDAAWADLRTKQADVRRSIEALDRQLADKTAELQDAQNKVAAANADLAALRTRLGVG